MTESSDLFGKIDALFEKRAHDVLQDKGLEHEDFPVLTEVVAAQVEENPQAAELGAPEPVTERRVGERRLCAHAATDFEPLPTGLEQHLSDLFIRQQLRLEEAMRRVIRDELANIIRGSIH